MARDVMSGVTKTAWDVMSGMTKTALDVLSGVANLCRMFCPGSKKMAWDILSQDFLSGSLIQHFLQFVSAFFNHSIKIAQFLFAGGHFFSFPSHFDR